MRREPRWVPRLVVEAVHLDQLREHGGLPGVRDAAVLAAALDRARNKWHYQQQADLAMLAAAYAFGVARSHAFIDGNKRTAFLSCAIFLGLNGKALDATETEVVEMMLALAAGDLPEMELADWIRARVVRLVL